MNPGTSSEQEFGQRAGKVNTTEPACKEAKIGEASRPDTYRTKLHDAVYTMDEAAVSHILRYESDLIDVQEDSSKMTALHIAATHGCREIVLMLLSAGSDVHLQNPSGMTALYMALECKLENIANAIIDAGTKNNIQDEDGRTVLHYAALRDCVEIVKRLLASGADPRLQDRWGMTALHLAVRHWSENSANVLIEAEAGINIQDNDKKTVLHYATENYYFEIVERLLSSGAETRLQDRSGMTVLHIALKQYWTERADVFIEADAENNNIQDKDGRTALHYAADKDFSEIVGKLLASGADTRIQDRSGMTALHVALKYRNKESAEVLVEADAESSNIQDKEGKTALHYAAEWYSPEAVLRQLLFREVNLHVSDNEGEYPLKAALSRGYEDVAKLILSMCVLRDIDIDWKKLDLDDDQTTFCAELLSEFEAELRRMKQAKLHGTSLSYHDFVRGHVSRVVRYLENENARSVLLVDDAARRFPNYGEFFAFKVGRAEKRRILNNQCLQCFAVLPKEKKQPSLPRICTDLILAHLSEREMQSFIASFRGKS